MAERDVARRSDAPVLLVGAGRRAREIAAVLGAVSNLDAAGERSGAALAETALADLEELLAPRPVEGLLILEAGRVPAEDIGFVRRFLERHPRWSLVLVGEDEKEPRARALAELERARWLPWPPDLDALRALLPRGAEGASAGPQRTGSRRSAARAAPATNGGVDLAPLLEECLAGAALKGEGTARYQLAASGGCLVQRERGALLEGLQKLVELARLCAGADGLVRAALDGRGDSARIRLEFPRAGLPEGDLPALLERVPAGLEPALAEGVATAREGMGILRELGARVELSRTEPGRMRCEVSFAERPLLPSGTRAGKPEDPFA